MSCRGCRRGCGGGGAGGGTGGAASGQCRPCLRPGGLGRVPGGRRLSLSPDLTEREKLGRPRGRMDSFFPHPSPRPRPGTAVARGSLCGRHVWDIVRGVWAIIAFHCPPGAPLGAGGSRAAPFFPPLTPYPLWGEGGLLIGLALHGEMCDWRGWNGAGVTWAFCPPFLPSPPPSRHVIRPLPTPLTQPLLDLEGSQKGLT